MIDTFRMHNGAEHISVGALALVLVSAARRGAYPSDGRFYYVAVTGALSGEYLTMPDALAAADARQKLANLHGAPIQFEVRTKDTDTVVYRPLAKVQS